VVYGLSYAEIKGSQIQLSEELSAIFRKIKFYSNNGLRLTFTEFEHTGVRRTFEIN